jgi:hypothetical protein
MINVIQSQGLKREYVRLIARKRHYEKDGVNRVLHGFNYYKNYRYCSG